MLGVVTKWLPAGADPESEPTLWHIQHEDGDEEQLEEYELAHVLQFTAVVLHGEADTTDDVICDQPSSMCEEEEPNESEEPQCKEGGEMSCTGGCKGKWSRYRFSDQNWNDDSLAEEGPRHAYSSLVVDTPPHLYHPCILTVYRCAFRYRSMCAMPEVVAQ